MIWYSLIFINTSPLTVKGTENLFSIYGILGLLLIIGLSGHLLNGGFIYLYNLIIFSLWGFFQWNAHWAYLIKSPSKARVAKYYNHFHNTLRIFPKSKTIMIPDMYHLILHLLIFVLWVISLYLSINYIRRLASGIKQVSIYRQCADLSTLNKFHHYSIQTKIIFISALISYI